MGKGFLSSILVGALYATVAQAEEPAKSAAAALPPVAEVRGAPACCTALGDCCGCCDNCHQPHRLWLTADYLMWWIKKGPQPLPLVSTGSRADDPFAGSFGEPNTAILFGGENLDYDRFNGMRFGLGIFLDPDGRIGVEGSYFALERRSIQFGLSS